MILYLMKLNLMYLHLPTYCTKINILKKNCLLCHSLGSIWSGGVTVTG